MHPVYFFKQLEKTKPPTLPGDPQAKTHVNHIHQQHGTTTLGFIFKEGIILSVDSRSTMGGYISSGNVKKVIPITSKILATLAGGAADCEYWDRNLARLCNEFEYQNGKEIGVTAAAQQYASIINNYKGHGMSIGAMLAGYDVDEKPHLFYCDDGGDKQEGFLFSVGSGATFAISILETGYKFDMTKEEAIDLGLKAVMHAAHRDAMSGGMQNVWYITKDGWKLVKRQDNYITYREVFGGEPLPRSII